MKASAQLVLEMVDETQLDVLRRALEPDNIGLPKRMVLRVKSSGRELRIGLDFEGDVETLLSTLDEFMHDVQLSTEIMAMVK